MLVGDETEEGVCGRLYNGVMENNDTKEGTSNVFILDRECFNDWPIASAVVLVCSSSSILSFHVSFPSLLPFS